MESVFLDTNILVDIFGRDPRAEEMLHRQDTVFYVATTSLLDWAYVNKVKAPFKLSKVLGELTVVSVDEETFIKALVGPTLDIEDNALLHTAVANDCTKFITSDVVLLKMGYFGSIRICPTLG